jgi:hypothetical protein
MANMRALLLGLASIGVTSYVLVSCGGEDRAGNLPQSSGGAGSGGAEAGTGATGGKGGSGGGGGTAGIGGTGGGDGGVNVPGAPTVKVISPDAATDPTNDKVIVGAQLEARCTAEKSTLAGALPVDPTTVKIAVLNASQAVVDEFPGTPTTNLNEYKASFVLSTVPTGKVSFRCMAGDTSTPPKTGADTLATFVDHGPNIAVTTPADGSAYPLTGVVPFVFKVSPALLATTDPESAVDTVKLTVNGVNITPTPDVSVPGGYKNAIDFNDKTLFPQVPSGSIPVVIEGTNKRTPTAAKALKSYNFTLDGQGPIITIKSPKNQDIIGGKVPLAFSVVDTGSGVDQKTINVELNQVQNLYAATTQWSNTADDYTFTFDSANVAGSKVQVTVNVTAIDKAGNKSSGASVLLYLDNQPPVVDLDPGNVRLSKKGPPDLCSESFDPLGTYAASDQGKVTPFKHFRAMVWEQTNSVSGQTVFYYAKTEPTSVYLYLQPDGPTVPLLINNDADPECDALNTVVGGKAIPNLQLNPVSPAGSAFYPNTGASTAPALPSGYCVLGVEPQPPATLCTNNASDMNVVVGHTMAGVEPVVYGIGQMTGLECTGTGWELSSQLAQATQKEGWFCLAAVAKDKVGNTGISRPLRVCYDDPGTSYQPPCWTSSTTPPSCTDGCTPPAGRAPFVYPKP